MFRGMRARWRWVSLPLLVVGCAARQPADRPSSVEGSTVPAWFLGVWKRDWVQRRGEPPFENKIVRDLQTPIVYGSVRIPLDRPDLSRARSFADLSDAELDALAKQRGGFSGSTSVQGDVAHWRHDIDFQPPMPGREDVGRLVRVSPAVVHEHALDDSEMEAWWSLSTGDGRFLGITVARAGRVEHILSVAGDHFVYARNRARDLAPADSLPELIAKTGADRAAIVGYLDCELSYGRVRGGRIPWEIVHSTLPWRERQSLDWVKQISVDATTGELSPRGAQPSGELWAYPVDTFVAAEASAMFNAP